MTKFGTQIVPGLNRGFPCIAHSWVGSLVGLSRDCIMHDHPLAGDWGNAVTRRPIDHLTAATTAQRELTLTEAGLSM